MHCHRLTPTADGPAKVNGSNDQQMVPKTPGTSSTSREPRGADQSAAFEYDDDAKQQRREAKLRLQVLEAASGTAATLACPMFEYRSVTELFAKASQPSKIIKKTGLPSAKHVSGKGGLAAMLKDRPELVFARAAGMPPVTDGFTVLHAAFAAGNLVTVRWLLDNVVDFDSALEGCGVSAATGETADGTQSDYYKIDVDARDQQGRTALHVASQLGQSEVVCYLFEVLDKMVGQDGEEEETDSEEEDD